MTEESLFRRAMELPEAERRAFVERECSDLQLRERMLALLAADAASSPLDRPLDQTAAPSPPQENPDHRASAEAGGMIIAGRYRLLQQIGEGGMGSVWMADQIEPIKRKVAVKLIRAERNRSKMILARFEVERQAIALMDHPHIAKLLDAGTTEDGSPFFVMELVRGIPLHEFCDRYRLTIIDRLSLFAQICGAVQHAHQKGVIHRDLKPTNILVESHDGKPVPKVIDFGLAKATTGLDMVEPSMLTAFGHILGTPQYMAPEQAHFNAVDVDTRADVYALGVVLYELLTGSTPITKEALRKAAFDEVLRLVREEEALPPSSRLISSDDAPSVAANRQTEPAKLGRFVRGELDWIVLKALAKDRHHRYETAISLAQDIERFLNHEPVSAGPPRASYRLRKFVRRNRSPVVAAAFVLIALIVTVIGTTWGFLYARKQERFAREAAAREAEQRLLAQANEREARAAVMTERKATAKAQQITDFLAKKLLGQADPNQNPVGKNLTVRELLDRAAAEIERVNLSPDTEGPLRAIIGKTYYGLTLDRKAEPHLRRAMDLLLRVDGPDAEATMEVMNDLALVLRSLGRLDEAKTLIDQILKQLETNVEENHPHRLEVQNSLALLLHDSGDSTRAEGLLRKLVTAYRESRGDEAEETLRAVVNLVTVLRLSGRGQSKTEAEQLLRNHLPSMERQWGNSKPAIYIVYNEMSLLLCDRGAYQEAERYCVNILENGPFIVGEQSDILINARNNLALIRLEEGKNAEAEKLLRAVIQAQQTRPTSEPIQLRTRYNLALAVYRQDRIEESLEDFIQVRDRLKTLLGAAHPLTLLVRSQLAENLAALGELDLAEKEWQQCLKCAEGSKEPALARMTGVYRGSIGWVRLLQGRLTDAESSLRAAQAELVRHSPNSPYYFKIVSLLGETLVAQKEFDAAEKYLVEAYRGLKANRKSIPPRAEYHVVEVIDRMILLYWLWVKPNQQQTLQMERKEWTKDSVRLPLYVLFHSIQKLLNAQAFAEAESLLRDDWSRFDNKDLAMWQRAVAHVLLGTALLGQKKYVEAEASLLRGYHGCLDWEKSAPRRAAAYVPVVLDRLVELYSAVNQPAEAHKYQELRMRYPASKHDP